ncbi:RNA polymerase sigma factor [Salisediminibacterium selenitireducens]|uniref:RNA polymerase, sigma-24 subunit, ECF subfamily n=1 Tax=Bacillus selenitireducens (strain ATCC 700615 / DSM 15326 / MLS10) TaxID=439292 RepID=D6XYM4_BACIE|nr:RNA polymerase sigma factor [Salisediminibacterium selenitireducens]ADH98182.1 RNA polymerase, sigma-24 subunit, ECF subfamily [[Bacillus] selenitireducens MLS10]
MTDDALIQAILEGDDQAVETLHSRYVDQLFSYVLSQVNDYHDAQELLQDILFKVMKHLHDFTGDAVFKTWMYTIARNRVIDYYRGKAKREKEQPAETDVLEAKSGESGSAERTAVANSQVAAIHDELKELPADYHDVLYLRFIEEFSVKETASIMKRTSFSVKALQRRARNELAKRLEGEVTAHE